MAPKKKPGPKSKGQNKSSVARALANYAGTAAGGYFGGPIGSGLGAQGANWLSDVLGFGDYTVRSNSLMNANSGVPNFTSSKHTINISHREFITDIVGSVAFSNRSFPINPGLNTFAWLSAVASEFQQYRFRGLLFEFVSTSADALNSTNTALGTVIMSTQYNSARAAFTSKLEMEQYEFSCSTRPSATLIHPIECSPIESPLEYLYVRDGAVPAGESPQFYDLGIFQLATVGMQAAATIGELWVTYDIECLKPRVQPGGSDPGQITRIGNATYTNTNVLGTTQTTPVGNLGVTITSTGAGPDTILIPATISTGRVLVNVIWAGTNAATVLVNPTLANLTASTVYRAASSATGMVYSPQTTVTAGLVTFVGEFTVNGFSSTGSTLQFTGMTLPSAGVSVDIQVVVVPLSDTFV